MKCCKGCKLHFIHFFHVSLSDKHFWSHGFVIAEKDKLECVPLFLSELANDIFVCGKSINLLKLCCPDVSIWLLLTILFWA